MSVIITYQDVIAFCPDAAAFEQSTIEMLIAISNQADSCLDANNVPDDMQKYLKLLFVCHSLAMQQGGQIKSRTDFDGASITFNVPVAGKGLSATSYGQLMLDTHWSKCFSFANNRAGFFMASLGGEDEC